MKGELDSKTIIVGRNFPTVQWLGLHSSIAGGMGLIPGWGTKILHAVQRSQK